MFSEKADVELYLTITKFNANMGYNLTQNLGESSQDEGLDVIQEEMPQKRQEILNQGAIPEYVRVSELYEVYRIFTEASLKNKILVK